MDTWDLKYQTIIGKKISWGDSCGEPPRCWMTPEGMGPIKISPIGRTQKNHSGKIPMSIAHQSSIKIMESLVLFQTWQSTDLSSPRKTHLRPETSISNQSTCEPHLYHRGKKVWWQMKNRKHTIKCCCHLCTAFFEGSMMSCTVAAMSHTLQGFLYPSLAN